MSDHKPWNGATYAAMLATIAALVAIGAAIATQSWQTAALAVIGWTIALTVAATVQAAVDHRRDATKKHLDANKPAVDR